MYQCHQMHFVVRNLLLTYEQFLKQLGQLQVMHQDQLIVQFLEVLLLFVTACAIYMNSELGIAPYDAVPKIISDRFVKLPFFVVRIIFDYSAITSQNRYAAPQTKLQKQEKPRNP